jgi:hypothetical protein
MANLIYPWFEDLSSKLKAIGERTLDNLEYVGEWHFSPRRVRSRSERNR